MLTSVDRAIIDLERTWWQQPGPKEWVIVDGLGMDTGVYYRRLAELLDEPEAAAYDPLTLRRLERMLADVPRRRAVGQR